MAEPHVALDAKALEAATREIWNGFAGRMGGEFPGMDSNLVAVAQCIGVARNVLASLPQQTAEPVATIEIFDGRSVLFAEKGAFSLPNGTHKLYASSVVEVPETIVEDYIMGEFVSNVGFEAEAVRKFAIFLRSVIRRSRHPQAL